MSEALEKTKMSQETDADAVSEALQQLVHDYLLAKGLTDTAKSFCKETNMDAEKCVSGQEVKGRETLVGIYCDYLESKDGSDNSDEKEGVKKSSSQEGLSSPKGDSGSDKKKRKRSSGPKKDSDATGGGDGTAAMKEESQKQYTFGWKRYTDYCLLHQLDPMIGEKGSADTQILEFARYLISNSSKSVKAAVANSYVSAVGKKLLEEKVITAMRDIRTPELKELFAEASRSRHAAFPTVITAPTTTTVVAVASDNSEQESQDAKKKKRGRDV